KQEYEEYVKDSKNYRDRWEYLLAYNDNDVEMMIKPIDNLINQNAQYKVDMISNLSLSKCSTSIKYALAYKDFDVNANYAIVNTVTIFEPSLKWWIKKCANYKKQDELYNAKLESKISKLTNDDINNIKIKSKMRNIENCVSENDYQKFLEMYKNEGYCYLCKEHFTHDNKPTLDRIDNSIGHELSNCKLACKICNNLRNRKDEKITRLRIQLKKYCLLHHLPTTVTDEKEYYNLRQNMTGGISNVLHRYCIKGETYINRFRYTNDNKVVSEDTENKITHILGLDFNSLYPSVFSSIKHDFIDYHGGVMFMPGSYKRRFEVYDENGDKNKEIYKKCSNIIFSKYRYQPNPKYLFIATVKLICPKNKINYFINFPPIIRNITIKNDEIVIGSYMYNYMKEHKLSSLNKEERRLTQLLDTCGQYMTFSNYYLWFLLDQGLVLEDIKSVSLYEAHNQFHEFVTTFMKKRQDIISKKEKGNEKFYKISMNGSYGYDGINSENFSKIKICNKDKAYSAIISDTYINGIEINDDCYLIQQQPKHFKCNTPLQEAFFTLDNAK
ncbi:hypothetical protein, partial [uncultured Brachyspira sp.]|uniref:hypothetical protein n=1 Tax=uncultured Brachyspira sp. TaxID=221953 RepID=UPI0025FC1881